MPRFTIRNYLATAALLASPMSTLPLSASEVPDPIAARGETLVAAVHATGTQVYECKTDMSGKFAWQFREPIATLFAGGQTVGRHYAGPHWEMADGSIVSAKVLARAPGASENDIPLLKLEVASWRGTGQLAGVTTIQRLNTRGGVAEGSCSTAGEILSVPYSADYTFYRRAAAAASVPVSSAPPAARAVAPRYIASPVAVPPPAIGVIIVRGDDRDRRRKKKKDHSGHPKSPPTQPTPPTAEPKSPPIVPNRTVRDHRGTNGGGGVTTTSKPRPPKVRDHRGSATASNDKPGGASSGGKPPSGPKPGSGSKPICGIGGTPPCNAN